MNIHYNDSEQNIVVGRKTLFRKLVFGSMEFWMNTFKQQKENYFAVYNRRREVSSDILFKQQLMENKSIIP